MVDIKQWLKGCIVPGTSALIVCTASWVRLQHSLEQLEANQRRMEAIVDARWKECNELRVFNSDGFTSATIRAALDAHIRRLTQHLSTKEEFKRFRGALKQLNPSIIFPVFDE